MKTTLFTLAMMLRVCWGPLHTQCGDYLGRYSVKRGDGATISYYVVRLSDKTVSLVEPDLILAINRESKS